MARKHENFYWSGYKYAPETVRFLLNGKRMLLPEKIREQAAYLAVCGKTKEVEDILKKALRKDEKQPLVIGKCVAFFEKNSDTFYYTKQLMYKPGDMDDALFKYKEFKKYIASRDCVLDLGYQVSTRDFSPMEEVKKTNGEERSTEVHIDLGRSRIVHVVRESMF